MSTAQFSTSPPKPAESLWGAPHTHSPQELPLWRVGGTFCAHEKAFLGGLGWASLFLPVQWSWSIANFSTSAAGPGKGLGEEVGQTGVKFLYKCFLKVLQHAGPQPLSWPQLPPGL